MGVGWSQEPWRPVSLPQALLPSPWEGTQPAKGGESGSVLVGMGRGLGRRPLVSFLYRRLGRLESAFSSSARLPEGLKAGEKRQYQSRGEVEDDKRIFFLQLLFFFFFSYSCF